MQCRARCCRSLGLGLLAAAKRRLCARGARGSHPRGIRIYRSYDGVWSEVRYVQCGSPRLGSPITEFAKPLQGCRRSPGQAIQAGLAGRCVETVARTSVADRISCFEAMTRSPTHGSAVLSQAGRVALRPRAATAVPLSMASSSNAKFPTLLTNAHEPPRSAPLDGMRTNARRGSWAG